MKYYEFTEPYYALIQAENREEALQKYAASIGEESVSDLEEETLDTLKELSEEEAWGAFIKGVSEDGTEIPIEEKKEYFHASGTEFLLIDGAVL